jgi:hypothetical protein
MGNRDWLNAEIAWIRDSSSNSIGLLVAVWNRISLIVNGVNVRFEYASSLRNSCLMSSKYQNN